MKTFFNILLTLTNQKPKIYYDEPFNIIENYNTNHQSELSNHIIFLINQIYYESKKSIHNEQYCKNSYTKFISLNSILDNSFYKKELKENIFYTFSKAQKHYYAFSRLARIYKFKKYPIVVSDDLMLNPLNIHHRNTFIFIDNKAKFLFNLNDLVSIIETSIGNSPDFFSDPLPSLNPYTKQPFNNSTLYNIYFKLKESGRLMSSLFHFFFLENFDINQFSQHYEPLIRENAINKFVFNSPYLMLYQPVLFMLKWNKYTKEYVIHKDFPKDLLVNIFRPFLFYYYIINYDIKSTVKVNNYKRILNIKLHKFYEYNKSFGRRYIEIKKQFGKTVGHEYMFNTKHISFYKILVNTNEQYDWVNNYVFTVYNNEDTEDDEEDNYDTEEEEEDGSIS